MIEPQEIIPYFDDVPLWLRLDLDNGSLECFSVFLDNHYVLATCEENTLIQYPLPPGNHSINLNPTHLATKGKGFRHDFYVLEPSERLPSHLSKDGWSLSLPDFVENFHVFWYNNAIWYDR